MFAFRTHRLAGGDSIDGQPFEHQRWTLVEELTPALAAATLPGKDKSQPRLVCLEVSDADDPLLGALPVTGHEAQLLTVEDDDLDVEHASLPTLKKLAKLLGLSRTQGRADLILAIRAKQAELETASEADTSSEAESETDGSAEAASAVQTASAPLASTPGGSNNLGGSNDRRRNNSAAARRDAV